MNSNSNSNSKLFDDNYGDDDFFGKKKESASKPAINEYSNMFENTKDNKKSIDSTQIRNDSKLKTQSKDEESFEYDYEDEFEDDEGKKSNNAPAKVKTPSAE